MADCLELTDVDVDKDCDRVIDSQDFKLRQYEIALHDYREFSRQREKNFLNDPRYINNPCIVPIFNWKRRLNRMKSLLNQFCEKNSTNQACCSHNSEQQILGSVERIDTLQLQLEDLIINYQDIMFGCAYDSGRNEIELREWCKEDIDLFFSDINDATFKEEYRRNCTHLFQTIETFHFECKNLLNRLERNTQNSQTDNNLSAYKF